MTEQELRRFLPQDKYDIHRARALVALGYPAVAPVLPQMLEWLMDYNWPVAKEIDEFLVSIGLPLVPYLTPILRAEQEDEGWKYWIVSALLRNAPDLRQAMLSDLQRIAYHPTPRESEEEVDEVAREVLDEMLLEPRGD